MTKISETAIVYMVAGLSSRFGKIKQFVKVGKNNEEFIECSIQQAISAGFNKIIFVVGEMTEKPFREKFGNNYKGISVYYAKQNFDKKLRDKPWGTIDALCSAKNLLDCPFVVCTGDDLYGEKTFQKLVNHLKKSNEEATIGYLLKNTLPKKGNVNRAIFEIDGNYVKKISDKFSIRLADEIIRNDKISCMTIFALHPSILILLKNKLNEFKEKNKTERKSEFPLHHALSQLIKERKIKMKIYPALDNWIGITNPDDEKIVREFLKNKY